MGQSLQHGAIQLYDRASARLVTETVLGDRFLRLAYRQPWRRFCNLAMFGYPWPSRLLGWYCDSRLSRPKIDRTIRDLDIDMADFVQPDGGYRTFNEFFHRRLKAGARPFDPDPAVLCAPADARYFCYDRIDRNTCIPVKGSQFTISQLLGLPPEKTACFDNGCVMVARLCPVDYHRYHFPASGRLTRQWEIPGRYDSVNPVALALDIPVFAQNWRKVSLLELEGFGKAAYVEVGAFGVAGIVQTHKTPSFGKMDEKGYFKFGGSTIVLVLPEGTLRLDDDLVANTRADYETLVKAGQRIGTAGSACLTQATSG